MITERLLGERYRFKEECIPYKLTSLQEQAKKSFLDEVHKKGRYIPVNECPYCGGNSLIKISEIDAKGLPSDIAICNICDGCFKSTVLDSEANRYHYENISYALRGKELSDDAIENLFWKRVEWFAYPRYHFIRHFLELMPDKDVIGEFGCNDGANLFPWFKNSFSVIGVELDSRMVEFGRKKGLNLIYGDLSDYPIHDKNPKLIILSHFLEHVTHLEKVLNRLSQLLHPNGYLFIEVPGISGQGLCNPLSQFDVEHNYYFDLNSLSRVLKRHFFKIIYADEYIRLICTPEQNKFTSVHKSTSLSLGKIKSLLLKAAINIINFKNKKLSELLKEGEKNSFRIKILNKLQISYFKFYYSSIIRNEQRNESK